MITNTIRTLKIKNKRTAALKKVKTVQIEGFIGITLNINIKSYFFHDLICRDDDPVRVHVNQC